MKSLKRPHSIYISPKCGDLQIEPINHARTFDWVLTGMKMKIKLHFTKKDTKFREKFEKKNKGTFMQFCFIIFADSISESNPRVIDDTRARKCATDLKRCSYYETCATYGLNVERVFQDGMFLMYTPTVPI